MYSFGSSLNVIPAILLTIVLAVSVVSGRYLPSYLWKEIILLIGMGFLILLFAFKAKKINFRFNRFDWIMVVFFLYCSLNAISQSKMIQATCFRLLITISLLLFYISVKMLCNLNYCKQRQIVIILFSVFIAQVSFGWLQMLGILSSTNSNFIVTGAFANSGTYANYLCITSGSVFPFLLTYPQKRNFVFYFLLFFFLMAVFLILFSASRTAWIGLVSVVFFMTTKVFIKEKKKFVWGAIIAFLILGIIALILTFSSIKFKESSAIGRLFIWQVSMKMFIDFPVFGVGSPNYAVMYQSYQARYFQNTLTVNNNRFHDIAGDTRFAFNDYLQVACEDGIIGIIILLFLIYFIVKTLFEKRRSEADCFLLLLQGALLVTASCSFTSYGLALIEFKVLVLLVLAIYSSFYISSKEVYSPFKGSFSILLGMLGFFLLSYGILRAKVISDISSYNSSLSLNKTRFLIGDTPLYLMRLAELQVDENDLQAAAEKLEELKMINPDKNIFYYLGQLYEKQGFYNLAERQYLQVYYTIPNLILPRFFLAKMYLKTNQFKKFEWIVKEALQMNLKIKSHETTMIRDQINTLYSKYKKEQKGQQQKFIN